MICCWSKSLFQILLVMDPLEPFFLDFLTALRLLKKICAWQLQSYWYQNIYNNVNRFFFSSLEDFSLLCLVHKDYSNFWGKLTVFEHYRKSRIQHRERSELRLHIEKLVNDFLQKFIKNAKYGPFGEFLKTWNLRPDSVTRHVTFNWTKIVGKCKNS